MRPGTKERRALYMLHVEKGKRRRTPQSEKKALDLRQKRGGAKENKAVRTGTLDPCPRNLTSFDPPSTSSLPSRPPFFNTLPFCSLPLPPVSFPLSFSSFLSLSPLPLTFCPAPFLSFCLHALPIPVTISLHPFPSLPPSLLPSLTDWLSLATQNKHTLSLSHSPCLFCFFLGSTDLTSPDTRDLPCPHLREKEEENPSPEGEKERERESEQTGREREAGGKEERGKEKRACTCPCPLAWPDRGRGAGKRERKETRTRAGVAVPHPL